jgi:hypothetical protein
MELILVHTPIYSATSIVKNTICQTNCSTIIISIIINSFICSIGDIEAIKRIVYNVGDKAGANTVAEQGWSNKVGNCKGNFLGNSTSKLVLQMR